MVVVPELVGLGAVAQGQNHIGQIPPVGSAESGYVSHPGLHQDSQVLADVVQEHLVVAYAKASSQFPLEGRLGLAAVAHDVLAVAALYGRQIRKGIPDRGDLVGRRLGPVVRGEVLLVVYNHAQVAGRLAEHVQWVGVPWQDLPGGSRYEDHPASGLWHPEVTRLQDPKGALVAHSNETSQSELEDQTLLEGHEVPDVLHYEEPRSVVVAVGQVAHHQGVLEERVGPGVEAVHTAEALAGRTTAQQIDLALLGQTLALY